MWKWSQERAVCFDFLMGLSLEPLSDLELLVATAKPASGGLHTGNCNPACKR